MICRLKFLGLALVATLVMSSVAASVVSADVLTSEAASTTLTGAQEGVDVLKVDGGELKCNTIKYAGTLSATTSSSFTVAPTYSGCTFAGLVATVNMNGCSFRFTINSGSGNTTGTLDIVNCSGKEMTITAPSAGTPKCIVHIPEQPSLGPLSFANLGSTTTREITMSSAITNIIYGQTAGTAETGNCAKAVNTSGGTLTGAGLFTGENTPGTAHIGIFLS